MIKERLIALLVLILLAAIPTNAQLHQRFYTAHDNYREPVIKDRRFKHADITPIIRALPAPFEVREAGHSVEGREIYQVKLGNGPATVLMWSQMHGDEPTATMALMDIFRFFQASGDGFDDYRRDILSKLTLYFVPMLNPDGAERFQRRNALGIDLNRDALRLTSPEAQLLKRIRDETDADWGFNLHDQSRYYAVGRDKKQASISFLAPAYNYKKEVNTVRGNAMKLIAGLNEVIQAYIPGQVGKYSDAFEPRAFGDNIQKWGTSTILIETGGYVGDPEKQLLRRLNFVALLSSFDMIANRKYQRTDIAGYNDIPFNNYGAFDDLMIQGVEIEEEGKWYKVDIAFKRLEMEYDRHRFFFWEGNITDIGDLSTSWAFNELDAEGYRAVPGKIYHDVLEDVDDFRRLDILSLLNQGYTDFFIENWPQDNRFHTLPIRLLKDFKAAERQVQLGGNPSLLLQKNGEYHYVVVNGFLYDLRDRGALRQVLEQAR